MDHAPSERVGGMRRTMNARHYAVFVALLCPCVALACGSEDDGRTPFDASSGGDASRSDASSGASPSDDDGGGSAHPAEKGDGKVGSACSETSDCDATLDLECLTEIPPVPAVGFPGKTFPGGMCTRRCGEPDPDSTNPEERELSTDCGPSAVCVQSSQARGGGSITMQMCLRICTGPSDCRTDEGYSCVAGLFGQKTCQAP